MSKKQRLELTWIGKNERPQLEPRILIEEESLSYHAAAGRGVFDNLVIQGDNLLALKALEQDYTGKVKCVFIDPPYNTGSAFEHYDDGIEHSLWLSLMRDRLEIIYRLLSEDGSLWVTLDDNEAHYFKVLCDEVFGRTNFVANVVWQKRYAPDARIAISDAHEHLFVYAVNPKLFSKSRNLLALTDAQTKQFRNPDNDPRGPWKADNFTAAGFRPNQMYEITLPSGRVVTPPEGRCWRVTEDGFKKLTAAGMMYYGAEGNNAPSVKRFLSDMAGMVPWTWWTHPEVGHSQEGKHESQALFGRDNAFATPKPERLLHRILSIATNPGDLVLDSFAGSGTTGAVAHKMGRRWIMAELGEHATTHIVPRLRKVIDGEDKGGVTETVGWSGGGGFRFCRLAPSLMERDRFGQWVISKEYDANRLAAAVAKHMGFAYQPSVEHWWMHGQSSERDFIYVTTASLTGDQLARISEEVGPDRTLLVACKAFHAPRQDVWPNLTIKRIPQMLLDRCEWGRDDYSLKITSLPQATPEPDHESGAPVAQPAKLTSTPDLFAEATDA